MNNSETVGMRIEDLPEPHKSKAIERDARFKEYLEDRKGWVDRRAADSQERAVKNVEIAKDIRARWLGGSKE
ncbi:hypothetical protein CcaverHIS631_0400120 [Cutaneotrichosporon cavernicola]|nr:hypothetical protein CcaverHIS631_0400120 [Cutaneotrichosporon cavernicola]